MSVSKKSQFPLNFCSKSNLIFIWITVTSNWNAKFYFRHAKPSINISQAGTYLTWLGRRVHKDGELDAVFLCRTNTARRRDPCEPHIHTVERGRDAHRQCVVNDCETGDQLVTVIGTAVEHFQRALGIRLDVHLKDVQGQPVSNLSPKQLQRKWCQQFDVKNMT